METVTLFRTGKGWKPSKRPLVNEWLKKSHGRTMGYYSAIKKPECMTGRDRKTTTLRCHLHEIFISKNPTSQTQKTEQWLPGLGQETGELL